jgi:hypothetical protein
MLNFWAEILLKREKFSIFTQERKKEIGRINSNLNLFRNLTQKLEVFRCLNGLIAVHFPLVGKIFFDPGHHTSVNFFVTIESFEQAEKSGKFVSVIYVFINRLNLMDDLYKVAHQVREN